jgi:hypothetical protein
VTAAIMVAAVAVPAIPAQAAGAIPQVDIAVSGLATTISQTTMRPGVVQFNVGPTFPIPDEAGGGTDTISIVRTDALDQVLAALPGAFGDDPAAAAQTMRTVHALSTWYGGGHEGDAWQVYLPPGNYYALGVQSTVLAGAQPVQFTVAGQPRSAKIHAVQAALWATGPVGQNQFKFVQLGKKPVNWFAFRNAAHEIHFVDITPVAPKTNAADFQEALSSDPGNQGPPSWVRGEPFAFDVVSPGVRVAIKHTLAPGRYLADCFIPSETDGMPHALMGMYKFFTVK